MANIITRFSIFTESDSLNIDAISAIIPLKETDKHKKAELYILKNDEQTEKYFKESTIDFNFEDKNITDIGVPILKWMNVWKPFRNQLTNILKLGFKMQLLFEINVFDLNTPLLLFDPEFLQFCGSSGIEVSFYFYYD